MNARKQEAVTIWANGVVKNEAVSEEPEEVKVELVKKQEKPKHRRKSYIEREPLPEAKRTRRRKDPALKKTHSFSILLTDQLYERFKMVAQQQGYSMNGIINRLIKKYVFLHDVDSDDDIGI